jgi:glycosyltransferase involved in cell wall biosynthesis
MNKPTLSVLMPNYNHSKYIGEAIEAILNQSYRPIEVIIIDDASTDNSIEIIKQFIKKHPILRLITNDRNMGANHNLNKLLELAKGDYVHFAAADDKILPGFYEKSMNLLSRYPQAGLCSTLSLIIDEENRNKGLHPSFIISKEECFITPEKSRSILEKVGLWVMGNATILRRNALVDSGGFIPELHSFTDGFIYQVIALKYGACFIPEPLACWRRMDSGYALSIGANPDVMKEVTRHAVHLMQTTYSDLFSKEYIDDFKRTQFFLMNLNQFCSAQKKKADFIRNDSEQRGVLKSVFLFISKLRQKFEKTTYILYLFVRFKPRIFPIVVRKSNRFFHPSIFYSSRKIRKGKKGTG